MNYDEVKDRLWRVSRELQRIIGKMPKADDRPRRAVRNRIGRAFADIMDAYSRICVNETFMKGLKHDEQD
jgi:hypothetical protein